VPQLFEPNPEFVAYCNEFNRQLVIAAERMGEICAPILQALNDGLAEAGRNLNANKANANADVRPAVRAREEAGQ
jgi:hypothetical protein